MSSVGLGFRVLGLFWNSVSLSESELMSYHDFFFSFFLGGSRGRSFYFASTGRETGTTGFKIKINLLSSL